MKQATYITGNPGKAKIFSEMAGLEIPHVKVDVDEIQSLDARQIAEHKARQAYEILGRPVIVEDTSLMFDALGALPGPLIKWFEEGLGLEKICRLLDSFETRGATASAIIAYYDGHTLTCFEGSLRGKIAMSPTGNKGFGWNPIFIPENETRTFAEIPESEFKNFYLKVKPFDELRKFLLND